MSLDIKVTMKFVYRCSIPDDKIMECYGTTDIKKIEAMEMENVNNDFTTYLEGADLQDYSVDVD
jgi:hypothetical protein